MGRVSLRDPAAAQPRRNPEYHHNHGRKAERSVIMRKTFAVLVLLLALASLAAAQETFATTMDSHVNVGDLMLNAGLNFGWGGLGVGGGAEFMFAKYEIPSFAPLTFGAAAKAAIYFSSGVDIDLAAMATMHLGSKGFKSLPAFLQNFDWYWGLGLGVGIGTWGGIGISTGSGICYYINPTLAVNADYFYTNYFGAGSGSSGVVGIRITL